MKASVSSHRGLCLFFAMRMEASAPLPHCWIQLWSEMPSKALNSYVCIFVSIMAARRSPGVVITETGYDTAACEVKSN